VVDYIIVFTIRFFFDIHVLVGKWIFVYIGVKNKI